MRLNDDSFASRAPRIAAGLTFAAVAAVHVVIVMALVRVPDTIAMPALYVAAGAVAGALGGRAISDPISTPTARRAALRGVAVMALALLLLWLVTLAIVLPNPSLRSEAAPHLEAPSPGNAFYAITTTLGLAYLTWMWWLIPLGALAGCLLYAWPRHTMIGSLED